MKLNESFLSIAEWRAYVINYSMSTSKRFLNYVLNIINNLNWWTFLLVACVKIKMYNFWFERDFENDDKIVLSQQNENKLLLMLMIV